MCRTYLAFVALFVLVGFVFGCHDAERRALYKFKLSFSNSSEVLSSWNGTECCLWDGVSCNNVTGYVEFLDLSNNDDMLTAPKLDPALIELKHLKHLDLSWADFQGSQIPGFIGSFKYLTYLDLFYTNFSPVLPPRLSNLTRLQHFSITGSVFLFASTEHMDVNTRNTMQVLTNLPLTYLRLISCQLVSTPHFYALLSNSTWLHRIETLDLSVNMLAGPFANVFANMSSLEHLYLSYNLLNGSIPLWLRDMTKLDGLHLSYNSLSQVDGGILGTLSQLKELELNYNSLEGELGGPHGNFSKGVTPDLELLDLSFNKIRGSLPYWLGEFRRLKFFDIKSNWISGNIPPSIGNLSALWFLRLSDNRIDGAIPEGLCLNNNSMQFLDFSSNKLSGPIPQSIGQLKSLHILYVNSNSLEGEIPQTFSLLSNLVIMDVGENNLSCVLPDLKSNSLRNLKFLRMRSNKLVGVIPEHFCALPSIQLLDLANNNLTGEIPLCFGHLGGMDSPSSAKTITALPPNLYYEVFAAEVIKGAEREYTSNLRFLVDLDLSCNRLAGPIPENITNLSGLNCLNLSHNHLNGGIPHNIGEMKSLESLDLSNNHLSGTIPSSLAALTSLDSLNLSNNQLTGQIPTGNQLQTLIDPSIYVGNKGLCGDPLPNKCRTTNGQQEQFQQQQESDKEDPREKIWLYFVIFSGFATGFWGFVGSLLLKRRFRFAMFHVLSNITDYFYVQIMIRINRLRG